MKKRLTLWIVCLLACIVPMMATVNIIPKPLNVTEREGTFRLRDGLTIGYNDPSLAPAATYLQEMLSRATGFRIKTAKKGRIQLTLIPTPESSHQEGELFPSTEETKELEDYELVSDKTGIRITAASYRGIINGIATLRQLLPNEIESMTKVEGVAWNVPAVSIQDSPNFHWRGLMLDPVRHFYSIEETKKLLDEMALYKLNKFHWHLSDNEGFRMEVKAYPGLTSDTVAWRRFNVHDYRCLDRAGKENNAAMLIPWKYIKEVEGYGELYGGYYTQDEIRDVVAYAAVRGIDIIPEIDMPGHNGAACYCYRWLSCTQDGIEPLCLGRQSTIEFAEKVYDEVFKLFPYEYVSIGGDEVNRGRWSECDECKKRIEEEGLNDVNELQAWFTKRMERYFNAHGRRILGWDEILEGGLSKTATVHWWRGDHPDVTQRSTSMGNEVVLCPFTYLYFDYAQNDSTLRNIYDGDIVPVDLTPEQLKLIKGMQGNIWGESIPTEARMQWMVFPRALALAEKAWTPRDNQQWDDFLPRLQQHLKRLDAMGIQYRPLQTNRP
ncbi:MAG: beta-N-acetylhexosaminidase [Bacteroidaceae bacterium]|nr:beta-N-acetylhexosaminidase [Bacteroidaceae bacterium]